MAKISNGFFCYGWQVAEPTLASGHNYVAICPAMPGVFHKEPTEWRMRQWCEAHDMNPQVCGMIDRGELPPPAHKRWMDVLGI